MVRFRQLISRLQESYWFLPLLITACALTLAVIARWLDAGLSAQWTEWLGFVAPTDAAGARSVLGMIGASAITVAGVVFSITMVVITMASAQFGPRLLRNFLRLNSTQVTLGTFIGTFIYCMVVMAGIRGHEFAEPPRATLVIGLVLGVLSFSLLIYFIHHLVQFIQASRVMADVGEDAVAVMCAILPERGGEPRRLDDALANWPERTVVLGTQSGYLQAIDEVELRAAARRLDGMVELAVRPGSFVFEGRPVMTVHSPTPIEAPEAFARALVVGRQRTDLQDPAFPLHQLAEISMRALSPGINDPFTALTAIGWLTNTLMVAGRRSPQDAVLRDGDGRPRLVRKVFTFADLAIAAFDQLRQYSAENPAVQVALLEALTELARCDLRPHDAGPVLRRLGEAIHDRTPALAVLADRARVEAAFNALDAALS